MSLRKFFIREVLKTQAILAWTIYLMEENRTSGYDSEKSERNRKKFRRCTKILEKRYSVYTDTDEFDNLIFTEE